MDIGLVEHITDIPQAEFDRLDQSVGVVACHARVRQRELDGRWSVSYVRGAEGAGLKAAVPLYACRSANWPDPAYDPRTWALPHDAGAGCAPERCLLVESYEDRCTGLHVERSVREPHSFRKVLAGMTKVAAQENRCLAFPYVSGAAKDALDGATEGRIAWTSFGREASLRDVSDPGWESRLARRVRYNLRRDKSLIASANITSAVRSWPEVGDMASDLIAALNVRKGQPDHPEFVRMRHDQWANCPQVELVVFTASSPTVSGVVTGLIWNDELDLREIGLAGEHGTDRRAAYLDVVFHEPLRFAQARQLRTIRLGIGSEMVKGGRGGVFQELYGGVLNASDTRRFGNDSR